MSAMKLQKLVYYSQAWHLVWEQVPLFDERIEAWANGPVVRELYDLHRGHFMLQHWPQGSEARLSPCERDTVDRVLEFYGTRNAEWLSALTHKERPWLQAREGLADGARGDGEISHESMATYYGSL
jgi:uncharacterized phage-associated protein